MGERLVVVPDGASPVEMFLAWEWATKVRAVAGAAAGPIELVCPGCGGTDDVDDNGSELGEPGTLERWNCCHGCGAEWSDVYVPVSRVVHVAGRRAASEFRRSGIFVDVDMAYEDRTDLGYVSDGWQS